MVPFQQPEPQCRRFIERFRLDLHGVRDATGDLKLTTHVRTATGPQDINSSYVRLRAAGGSIATPSSRSSASAMRGIS